jgi:hypothetical protein
MNEAVVYGRVKIVQDMNGQYYTLQQLPTGILRLWKGKPGALQCIVWTSGAVRRQKNSANAYTKMQNDGNLVTYWRLNQDPFIAVWSTETTSGMGSFTFVIDVCTFATPALAVYAKNPLQGHKTRR